MDTSRKRADPAFKYSLYFKLLRDKIEQYDIEPRHIYNMDEMGFLIGVWSKMKRLFSRRRYEAGEIKQLTPDGNREWITTIACICADGSSLTSYATSWTETLPKNHQKCVMPRASIPRKLFSGSASTIKSFRAKSHGPLPSYYVYFKSGGQTVSSIFRKPPRISHQATIKARCDPFKAITKLEV